MSETDQTTTHTETIEQAVEAGRAVHFNPATALECGYHTRVILTVAAYREAVEWTRPGDDWMQDMDGRFWDLLNMARRAAQAAVEDGRPHRFRLMRVPNRTPSGAFSTSETPGLIELVVEAQSFGRDGSTCVLVSTSRPGVEA